MSQSLRIQLCDANDATEEEIGQKAASFRACLMIISSTSLNDWKKKVALDDFVGLSIDLDLDNNIVSTIHKSPFLDLKLHHTIVCGQASFLCKPMGVKFQHDTAIESLDSFDHSVVSKVKIEPDWVMSLHGTSIRHF